MVTKGDTRSLDYGSCCVIVLEATKERSGSRFRIPHLAFSK